AGAICRRNVHKQNVVVDRQRRNGSSVGPHQVVLRPALAVALKGEVGIVGDDIAVDHFQALAHQVIGQILEHLDRNIASLGAEVVWENAAGKIRIAASDENQVSIQPAIDINDGAGFDRSTKLVIGANERQDSGRGE